MTDWQERHQTAMLYPRTNGELAISKMMQGIEQVLITTGLAHGAKDYVVAPYIGQMLTAFIGLLSCVDPGRIDQATCARWAESVAESIGYDLGSEQMVDA